MVMIAPRRYATKRREASLTNGPSSPASTPSWPTRLGDILRIAEDYARERDRLDPHARRAGAPGRGRKRAACSSIGVGLGLL